MTPTLGGQPVFGSRCSVATPIGPRCSDTRGTFGADGLERFDGGYRGNKTLITGLLDGYGPAGLAAAEALVRSFNDGQARDFVDSLGTTWPAVLLVSYQPEGRIRQTSYGYLLRPFRVELLHLI